MAMRMVGFSRNKSTDRVWGANILDENMEPQMGAVQFTFDKKTVYNFWTDYEKLSPEQKWLFDDANESWAKFKATDEECRELEKLHPNWKLPDDLEDEPVNYELVDIEEFSDEDILTMLLREDHFCNGSFAERLRDGDVQPLLERMLEVAE